MFVFRLDSPENIQSAERYSEHFQETDLSFLSYPGAHSCRQEPGGRKSSGR